MTRPSAVLLIASLTLPIFTREPMPYVRDPAHSQINFLASSRLIDAQGYWDRWEADIRFDPDAINTTSLTVTIDARSVNTRVEMRDHDLRSKNFFWADSFPVITFQSRTVNAPGGPPKASPM